MTQRRPTPRKTSTRRTCFRAGVSGLPYESPYHRLPRQNRPRVIIGIMHRCTHCELLFPLVKLICYYKYRSLKTGIEKPYYHCFPCSSAINKKNARIFYKRHSQRVREGIRKGGLAHPERHRARRKLSLAIYRGQISRPTICQYGCQNVPIEGHHTDYSKPLSVLWLCRFHHEQHHKAIPSPSV